MSDGDVVIRAEGVGKRYRLGAMRPFLGTLRDALSEAFRRKPEEEGADSLWALRDVSFEVRRGEVVGVIGRNGAGKSTLLKILSRITHPTEGRIALKGRVGALLEVGTGFHPELTGRENIYLNGAVLGMRRAEIRRKFDEIVAFSEIEKFLDTPVKRYSSGMYVRLAFAVAAHLEPEILIVDEVLAVGDAQFQKKCLGKMGEITEGGRTVLFVSHQLGAVSNLCGTVLLLDEGRLAFLGPTAEGLNRYRESFVRPDERSPVVPSGQANRITNARLFTSQPNFIQEWGAPMRVEFDVTLDTPAGIEMDVLILDADFNSVALQIYYDFDGRISGSGTYRVSCEIPKTRLYMGKYHVTLLVQSRASRTVIDRRDHLMSFEVVMDTCRLKATPWLPDPLKYIEDSTWGFERIGR